MLALRARWLAAVLGVLVVSGAGGADPVGSWEHPPQPSDADWQAIAAAAKAVVDRETPAGAFPFETPEAPASSSRLVFAHYFPPYPLSLDDRPAAEDDYALRYMKRSGEDGKYAKFGGLVRDRPLATPQGEGKFWRQINYGIEILRARRAGLDGFGVDIVQLSPGPWNSAERMVFETAAAVAPGFLVMPEPDANILRSVSVDDLAGYLVEAGKKPAAYRLADGRLVVAPFAPELKPASFWRDVMQASARRGQPIALLPVFLNPGAAAKDFAPISYGFSHWGERSAHAPFVFSELRKNHPDVKIPDIWMNPVVPQDVRPRNSSFWESGGAALFRHGWEEALRDHASLVQLVTWNDYSESTELAPSLHAQFLFADLNMYYATWFRTGQPPKILRDAIYFTHRRQIIGAPRTTPLPDLPMRSRGDPLQNNVEMLALLTAPATLEITMAGRTASRSAPAGLQIFTVPATPGAVSFRLLRNGRVIAEVASPWRIETDPDVEDPTYAGGSSTRAPVNLDLSPKP